MIIKNVMEECYVDVYGNLIKYLTDHYRFAKFVFYFYSYAPKDNNDEYEHNVMFMRTDGTYVSMTCRQTICHDSLSVKSYEVPPIFDVLKVSLV